MTTTTTAMAGAMVTDWQLRYAPTSFQLNENIFILFNHIRQKKWQFLCFLSFSAACLSVKCHYTAITDDGRNRSASLENLSFLLPITFEHPLESRYFHYILFIDAVPIHCICIKLFVRVLAVLEIVDSYAVQTLNDFYNLKALQTDKIFSSFPIQLMVNGDFNKLNVRCEKRFYVAWSFVCESFFFFLFFVVCWYLLSAKFQMRCMVNGVVCSKVASK